MNPEDARRDAIRRADAGANDLWKEAARLCIISAAWANHDFTADEVWDWLRSIYPHLSTPNPSALGPVFLKVAAEGLITKTGTLRLSRFSRRHRDLTVWRAS